MVSVCFYFQLHQPYRLNKYQEEGIIKQFVPIFDWSKFGYDYLVNLLLKFEKPSSIKSFIQELFHNIKGDKLISEGIATYFERKTVPIY